jgi:hypothetical protein
MSARLAVQRGVANLVRAATLRQQHSASCTIPKAVESRVNMTIVGGWNYLDRSCQQKC